MSQFGETRDKWVCPTDRELVLRSRLQTGWSVKTHSLNTFKKPAQLNDFEQEAIRRVIDRAESLELQEQERVGRLVERVENMKKNAIGNGETQCILCADEFSMLRSSPLHCYDCRKAVCSKCGVDTYTLGRDPVWLCKICSETREMWKKSGAWFFKSIPKYVMPKKKKDSNSSNPPRYRLHEPSFGNDTAISKSKAWSQGRFLDSSERESTDSSDDDARIPRATLALSERLSQESYEHPSAGSAGGAAAARDLPYHYDYHSQQYMDSYK